MCNMLSTHNAMCQEPVQFLYVQDVCYHLLLCATTVKESKLYCS